VTALIAERELGRDRRTVIHNLITSRAVPELVAERGGTAGRSRVGHSYIKGLMAETGAIFGGEHSAHYYFRDFWGRLRHARRAARAGGTGRMDPLSELASTIQRYAASGEINFTVADAPACVDAVLKSFADQTVRSTGSTA
jgi:phosphomannomutase